MTRCLSSYQPTMIREEMLKYEGPLQRKLNFRLRTASVPYYKKKIMITYDKMILYATWCYLNEAFELPKKRLTARCWIHSRWLYTRVPPRSTVSWSLSMWSCSSSTEFNIKIWMNHTIEVISNLKITTVSTIH